MDPKEPEFSVLIEYEDFITRLDLNEILGAIDRIIERELGNDHDPEAWRRQRYPSLLGYWADTLETLDDIIQGALPTPFYRRTRRLPPRYPSLLRCSAETLSSIDDMLHGMRPGYLYPLASCFGWGDRWGCDYSDDIEPGVTYVGIKSVSSGSIELFLGVVTHYAISRFAKGFRGAFDDQLVRTGRLTGEALSRVLEKINDWAEQYVRKEKRRGGNVTRIKAKPKSNTAAAKSNTAAGHQPT